MKTLPGVYSAPNNELQITDFRLALPTHPI